MHALVRIQSSAPISRIHRGIVLYRENVSTKRWDEYQTMVIGQGDMHVALDEAVAMRKSEVHPGADLGDAGSNPVTFTKLRTKIGSPERTGQ